MNGWPLSMRPIRCAAQPRLKRRFGKGDNAMGTQRYQGNTVLLADDDKYIRDGLRAFFNGSGYRVVGEAADGMEAVSRCRSIRPDLVLLDVKMPLLDGIAAARIIREEGIAHCVVMLTSFDDGGYVEQALAAGAAGYLTKPLREGDILPTLDICLNYTRQYYLMEKSCAGLKRRLAGRESIQRAKLSIMESRGLSEEESYVFIRELSRRKNLSMEQVACMVLEGEAAAL